MGKRPITLCSAHLPADQDKDKYRAACHRLAAHLRTKTRLILGVDANAQLTSVHTADPYIGTYVHEPTTLTDERDIVKSESFAHCMLEASVTLASTQELLIDSATRPFGPSTRHKRTLDYIGIKDLDLRAARIWTPQATLHRSDHRALALSLPSRTSQTYRFAKVRDMRKWKPISENDRAAINDSFRSHLSAFATPDVRHVQQALETIIAAQRDVHAIPEMSTRALRRLKRAAAREAAKWAEHSPRSPVVASHRTPRVLRPPLLPLH